MPVVRGAGERRFAWNLKWVLRRWTRSCPRTGGALCAEDSVPDWPSRRMRFAGLAAPSGPLRANDSSSACVGGVVAVEGEDELFDGGDVVAVKGGGMEAPGLYGLHDEVVEAVAEALDELLVGDLALVADGDVDDDFLLNRREQGAVGDGVTRKVSGEGSLSVLGAGAVANHLLRLLRRGAGLGEVILGGGFGVLRSAGLMQADRIFDQRFFRKR